MTTIADAAATVIPSETPQEHLRTVAQILGLAEYGETADGGPARILSEVEYKRALARLIRAARQLEAQTAHVCTLPSSIVEALNSGDGTYRP